MAPFARPPRDLKSCESAAQEQLAAPRPWSELADLLRASSAALGVPTQALSKLESLADGKAVCVVTGQQVGYLGGPLFTFLKAYHATRLAQELETELGIPVIPVFWLEGEDHDLEEVRDARYLTKSGQVQILRFSPETEVAGKTVGQYRVRSAAQVNELMAAVDRADPEAAELLRECYANSTLSEAMGMLIARTLGPRGMIVVEGMNPRLKKMAAPLWKKIVASGEKLSEILHARSSEIEAAGYPAAIHSSADSYLFYVLDDESRRVPVYYPGKKTAGAAPDESAKWIERLIAEPQRLSPKASLRPLYQDFVLPTVAFVAGPGEMSYHMQLAPFYRELGVVPPSIFPRISATITDAKTMRNVEKLNLTALQLLTEPAHVLNKLVLRDSDHGNTAQLFEQSRAQIEAIFEQLKAHVAKVDPTLEGLANSVAGKALHPLEQLREKSEKALRQQHASTLAKLEKILNTIRPQEKSAERWLCTGFYLLRFGVDSLLSALDELPALPNQHFVITMNE